jgi:hypothetical protein
MQKRLDSEAEYLRLRKELENEAKGEEPSKKSRKSKKDENSPSLTMEERIFAPLPKLK